MEAGLGQDRCHLVEMCNFELFVVEDEERYFKWTVGGVMLRLQHTHMLRTTSCCNLAASEHTMGSFLCTSFNLAILSKKFQNGPSTPAPSMYFLAPFMCLRRHRSKTSYTITLHCLLSCSSRRSMW